MSFPVQPYQQVLFISPSAPKVAPLGSVQLVASGGSGGYSFSLFDDQSGASVTAGGLYTAGPQLYAVDTVLVTDSAGSTFTREVRVMDGPTLSSIRTDAKARADLVNSQFVTDPEWDKYIVGGAFELYDKLVTAYGNDYNVAPPFVFSTDGLTERYPLPPDHFKLKGIDVQVSNNTQGWLPVPKFNFNERNKFMVPYQVFYGIRTNLRHRLEGDYVWIIPVPAAGQFMRMHYVPRMTKPTSDTDVIDCISGWEEYIIADACIKASIKSEREFDGFARQKQDQSARIDQIAEDRDISEPSTIVDVRSEEDFNGGRGGFY